ncbi:PAS domain-containing sensor histidine kinase [Dechloromonas denitrificans]|uniref:PAS domain-containing sensor histidine kinase n=1 Tax=Dechloromonas denitrificans TaxID=281362 RepID=UPI001CF8AFB0|nr:PAS domain-containing sensor histidine kinase [Dechloromonas denitrificans]UCV02195.1 PAS domain S-box protein [Dechloromonas denitrificans]
MRNIAPTPPSSARRLRWLLALPKLGIVLLLTAILSLLWLLHRNEMEEERAALIKDVLWLEQSLRFHLNSNEEQLQQLAADLTGQAGAKKLFRLRAGHQLKNNPEISQLLWFDAQGSVIDALPTTTLPDQEIAAFGPPVAAKAFELASRLGKRYYSEPFFLEGNRAVVELMNPIFDEGQLKGMLVVVYPLDALLGNLVPWWFTEKYKVEIIDDNDIQYATKTNIDSKGSQSYEIPFDPPGFGMKLRISNYQNADNSLQRGLTLAIFALAAGVFWSLWIVRDLMKKRSQAEEALSAEHAFRTAMEDSLTVGMRARDLNGKVIYVNPAFCKITGFSREEIVGTSPPMPYWVPEQIEETFAQHQRVMAGNAPPDGFEITFMRKNGERFDALVYEAKLIDGKGQHTGWMASILDVTERNRAEEFARMQHEQLQFTSRLVTMGEMASTLAHELNQPLAAIASYNTGCLNLLDRPACDVREIRPALEKIGVQAQRAGKIIRRVHDFVRKSEPKRAPCALGEVIEDCLGFVEPDARKRRIRIECTIPGLPPIPADRLMLEQVLLNLIRNGMEAMAATPEADRVLHIATETTDSELRISVSDQGCGIAPEIRDKLFTAFFTTKPEGMGVGLSICRSIIEFHRGRLWAEDNTHSPTGSGTIFAFTLPLEAA